MEGKREESSVAEEEAEAEAEQRRRQMWRSIQKGKKREKI